MASRQRALLFGLWGLVVVLLVLVLVGATRGATPAAGNQACTHGVSSVGPVEIVNGQVVGGSTTPHTDACLP